MSEFPQKALSIRQPWAWLIVNGFKDVENRNWKTNYRGPVLVHAAQKIEKYAYEWVEWRFGSKKYNIPEPDKLERGGIVGVTNIVDCIQDYSESRWHALGAWGFILKDSRPLPFMACKGKLSFFKVDYQGVYNAKAK